VARPSRNMMRHPHAGTLAPCSAIPKETRLGVRYLEGMQQVAKGYSGGGYVGSAPAAVARGARDSVNRPGFTGEENSQKVSLMTDKTPPRATRPSSARAAFGFSANIVLVTAATVLPTGQLPRSWAVRLSACGTGVGAPRVMQASCPDRRARRRHGSRPWNVRTANSGKPTRS